MSSCSSCHFSCDSRKTTVIVYEKGKHGAWETYVAVGLIQAGSILQEILGDMEDLNGQGSEKSEFGCCCSGLGSRWLKSQTVSQPGFREFHLSHHYPIPHSLLVKTGNRNDTRGLSCKKSSTKKLLVFMQSFKHSQCFHWQRGKLKHC